MARNFAGVIARVWRISSELGNKNRKHAMLWIFQVFAPCRPTCVGNVWAVDSTRMIETPVDTTINRESTEK